MRSGSGLPTRGWPLDTGFTVAESGGKTRVELMPPPPDPVTSRPLVTGTEFTLVLPKHRVFYRGWDKDKYAPGDDAELIIEGEGLGEKPLEITVERADGSPVAGWNDVATLKATPDGGKEAKVTFKIPLPPPHGKIISATWAREQAKAGERLGMDVELEGYKDGDWIVYDVEEQYEDGWRVVGRWQGTIKDSKSIDVYQTIKPVFDNYKKVVGELSDLAFEDEKIAAGDTAWLKATAHGLDGEQVQFVLEHKVEGEWKAVGESAAQVGNMGSGKVHVGIHVPKGEPGPVATAWRWDGPFGADLICRVREMDQQTVTFVLERGKTGGKDDEWTPVRTIEDVVVEGEVAQVQTEIPALVKAQFDAKKYAAPKMAELVVKAAGMDGLAVDVIIERKDGEEWVEAGKTTGKIDGHEARIPVMLPAGKAELLAAAFKFGKDNFVDLVAQATGLEGQELNFVLERQTKNGWEPVARYKAPVDHSQATVETSIDRTRVEGGVAEETEAEQLAEERTEEDVEAKSSEDGKSEDGKSEDGKSDDGKSEDGKSEDGKSEDGKSEDGKSEDGKSEDGKSEDAKSEDGKSEDAKSEDGKSEDGKSEDGKSEDAKSADGKPEDAKSADGKPEDAKSADGKAEDAKSADGKPEDAKSADAKSEDAKSADAKSADGKPEDAKSEDAKSEDAKSEDAKSADAKSADAKSADAKSADAKSADGKGGAGGSGDPAGGAQAGGGPGGAGQNGQTPGEAGGGQANAGSQSGPGNDPGADGGKGAGSKGPGGKGGGAAGDAGGTGDSSGSAGGTVGSSGSAGGSGSGGGKTPGSAGDGAAGSGSAGGPSGPGGAGSGGAGATGGPSGTASAAGTGGAGPGVGAAAQQASGSGGGGPGTATKVVGAVAGVAALGGLAAAVVKQGGDTAKDASDAAPGGAKDGENIEE